MSHIFWGIMKDSAGIYSHGNFQQANLHRHHFAYIAGGVVHKSSSCRPFPHLQMLQHEIVEVFTGDARESLNKGFGTLEERQWHWPHGR